MTAVISSRTPEGTPGKCPVCGHRTKLEASYPANDAPCPQCGHLLFLRPPPTKVPNVVNPAPAVQFGPRRLGPLPERFRVKLEALRDPAVLERFVELVQTAKTWDEVFTALGV